MVTRFLDAAGLGHWTPFSRVLVQQERGLLAHLRSRGVGDLGARGVGDLGARGVGDLGARGVGVVGRRRGVNCQQRRLFRLRLCRRLCGRDGSDVCSGRGGRRRVDARPARAARTDEGEHDGKEDDGVKQGEQRDEDHGTEEGAQHEGVGGEESERAHGPAHGRVEHGHADLLERHRHAVVTTLAARRHEGVTGVDGRVDAPPYAHHYLDGGDGRQRQLTPAQEADQTDDDAHHRQRDARHGDRMWNEDERREQESDHRDDDGKQAVRPHRDIVLVVREVGAVRQR